MSLSVNSWTSRRKVRADQNRPKSKYKIHTPKNAYQVIYASLTQYLRRSYGLHMLNDTVRERPENHAPASLIPHTENPYMVTTSHSIHNEPLTHTELMNFAEESPEDHPPCALHCDYFKPQECSHMHPLHNISRTGDRANREQTGFTGREPMKMYRFLGRPPRTSAPLAVTFPM